MDSTKQFVRTVGLAVIACLATAQGLAEVTIEDTVATAENQWLKAEQTNNADLIAPLLADKIVVTTEQGNVLAGKSAVLANAKATTWAAAKYEDLKVTVFDRTAIATVTFIGKGADASGKTFNVKLRFTDTWVRMANGQWLCVAGHDSPAADR